MVAFAVMAASGMAFSPAWAGQDGPVLGASRAAELVEVPQPDLAGVDAPVQEQIRAAQAALGAALAQRGGSHTQMAGLFGKLGQIYQAYGFDDAALACYRNAAQLDAQPFAWLYYQGYLRQKNGDAEGAERDYERAVALHPDDYAARLRLGGLELTLNHLEAARDCFAKALAQRTSAAALVGLGKVALAEHQYSAAVKYFKDALAQEPQASSVHYPLAMAYRELGDVGQVERELRARGDAEPETRDPLLDEVNRLKQGKLSLVQRGGAAMREGRFDDAVAAFRQLVAFDPTDALAYEYLGVALARQGKAEEALKEYAEALRLDPNSPSAHYDMGILLIEQQREEEAIREFRRAVQLDPGLVSGHFQLANLLMRKREDAEAEREYGAVAGLDPKNEFARFMQAMAAVHEGSYARARTLLEDAAAVLPNDADIANALARVLAAAPDAAVRDPRRALRLVEGLVRTQQGNPLEVGITLAMALAAVGQFQQAAAYQRAVIEQLEGAHEEETAHTLRANLGRYQRGETCAMPWASDDPVFTPIPGKLTLSAEMKTTAAHP